MIVGPYAYRITLDTPMVDRLSDDDEKLNGFCDHEVERIYIREGLSDNQQRVTVLHEVLHGVFAVSGIDHDDETKIISAIEAVLLDTLQRNRPLRAYLFGDRGGGLTSG